MNNKVIAFGGNELQSLNQGFEKQRSNYYADVIDGKTDLTKISGMKLRIANQMKIRIKRDEKVV